MSGAVPLVRTSRLSKRYGAVDALHDLDLTVEAGEIFGYLGPNGAGKTTTIRILLDLIRPTSGTAQVFGLDPRRDSLAIRKRIGYLPGDLVLYERLTGLELLSHFGYLRGGFDAAHARGLATLLDLDLSRPIHALSKGNKQKVGLVQAFMHHPELIVLDEPSNGLDPLVQQTVHQLMAQARDEGATVFISSHVLSEVERVADRVGVLRAGSLIAVEDIDTLKAKAVRRVSARLASPPPKQAFEHLPGVTDASIVGDELHLRLTGSVDPLVKLLARHTVLDLEIGEPDLEEIFLALYRGGDAHAA